MRSLPRRRHGLQLVLLLAALSGGATTAFAEALAPPPRPLNQWRVRCATDRDEIKDALTAAQGTRVFADLDSAGQACRILAASGGPCAQARAEMLATVLNLGAGRLSASECVQAGDELKPVAGLVESADTWIFRGCTALQCERIMAGLRGVNDGTRLSPCDGSPAPTSVLSARDVAAAPIAEQPADPAPTPESLPSPVPAAAPLPGAPAPTGQAAGPPVTPEPALPVLPPPPGPELPPAGACCDPRTATAWQRACTSAGKWKTLTDMLDSDNMRDFGLGTCAGLASPDIDPREESKRQLIALRLNVRSGYLAPNCMVRGSSGTETVEQAAQRAFRARREGRLIEARDIAVGVNEGSSLVARMPCAKPAEGMDLAWEPPPPVVALPEPAIPESPTDAPPPKSKRRPKR